jgi:hypothetical protein
MFIKYFVHIIINLNQIIVKINLICNEIFVKISKVLSVSVYYQ